MYTYITDTSTYDSAKASQLTSSEVSKADAAITGVPSSVNVLEEDVSENPEHCVMGQPYLHLTLNLKAANQLTTGEAIIRGRASDASIQGSWNRSKIE